MKNGILISTGILTHSLVLEQVNQSSGVTQNVIKPVNEDLPLETILAMTLVGLLIYLIISLVKYFLDHRLKNKLIDKGGAEHLSSLIQENNATSKKNNAVKMAILFCGIGVGLLITYLTIPIHIHSLAIMAFSIGLAYLAYSIYLKNQMK